MSIKAKLVNELIVVYIQLALFKGTMSLTSLLCLVLLTVLVNGACAWSINDMIRDKVEEFREHMPCGIKGGPPLAPFQHELLDIDVDTKMIT